MSHLMFRSTPAMVEIVPGDFLTAGNRTTSPRESHCLSGTNRQRIRAERHGPVRRRLFRRRGKRQRWVGIGLVICVIAFITATARLFVWPDQGMPTRVSAIVMLNGPGDRLNIALDLAWQRRAPFVVISRGSPI